MTSPTPETISSTVVGRFAPTPSGRMHLGNVFSALIAWLSVRACGGKLILRIEDLDPRGKDKDAASLIIDDLLWLGLDWDEGPYYQSERLDVYEEAVRMLSERGLTYPCFCTRAELHAASAPHASDGTYLYQGTCRNLAPQEVARRLRQRRGATRLRVPEQDEPWGRIDFCDLVYGLRSETLARECGDFLIRRSDGVFAYQLAVCVDDALMGVNLVVRGRDLLGSTARQVYLHHLLGYSAPNFAHVPLLVAADGRRLSKRDRDLDLRAIREDGIEPRSVISRLAACAGLCGQEELLSTDELVGRFSWEAIRSKAANGDIVVC